MYIDTSTGLYALQRPTVNYNVLCSVFFTVLQMDADAIRHEFILLDEAEFNLTKVRRRERNLIGHRAFLHVPAQRGGNITMCAAITQNGVLHRHAKLDPYNTNHRPHGFVTPEDQIEAEQ